MNGNDRLVAVSHTECRIRLSPFITISEPDEVWSWSRAGRLEWKTGLGHDLGDGLYIVSGPAHYSHDPLGNLTHATAWWNSLDGSTGGMRELAYLIDGDGSRAGRLVEGGQPDRAAPGSRLWQRAGGRIVLEYRRCQEVTGSIPACTGPLDTDGMIPAARYVYGDRPLVPEWMELVDASGTVTQRHRLVTDDLGSVRMVLSEGGAPGVLAPADYDPFGQRIPWTQEFAPLHPFGFAGGLHDPDTRLYRFGARDYDPRTGRWLARDPILFDGGTANLYEYCGNDPVNCTDPSGMAFLFFDRQKGKLYVDPEIKGRTPYIMQATSGRDECVNNPSSQNEKDRGVIPGGFYTADVGEISDPSPLGDVKRFFSPLADRKLKTADWGDWRVPLKPQRQLNDALGFDFPGNRNNFFLHGGIRPGSAGCIDFGGGLFGNKDTDRLLNDLRSDPDGTIWLFVK